MSDEEKFLERWSRKKRDAAAVSDAPKIAADIPAPPTVAALDQPDKADRPTSSPAAPMQKFDLPSLPSIESITAETDIRGFFAPGVPPELTHAALRRAWSADPAIRDYIGLVENAWDFNAPTGVPGFEELLPDVDIKKLAAQLLGEPDKSERESEAASTNRVAAMQPPPQIAAIAEESAPPAHSIGLPSSTNAEDVSPLGQRPVAAETTARGIEDQLVQRDRNDATHNNSAKARSENTSARRQHGSALPK